MDGDTIHAVADFGKLPWDKLKPEDWSKGWSCGHGGYGFSEAQIIINTFKEQPGIACDIWPVPAPLAAMIEGLMKIAKEKQLREIHRVLGIQTTAYVAGG